MLNKYPMIGVFIPCAVNNYPYNEETQITLYLGCYKCIADMHDANLQAKFSPMLGGDC